MLRIQILVLASVEDPDPSSSYNRGSGHFGRIRTQIFWSNQGPGVLVGSGPVILVRIGFSSPFFGPRFGPPFVFLHNFGHYIIFIPYDWLVSMKKMIIFSLDNINRKQLW